MAEEQQLPCDFHLRIACGTRQTCALHAINDTVECWGDASNDVHSQFESANEAQPQFHSVSVGRDHACGLTVTEQVRCWGTGDKAKAAKGYFRYLSVSRFVNCGIRSIFPVWDPSTQNTLYCWGDSLAQPELINDVPGGTFTSVSVGREWACAVRMNGTLACWGKCFGNTTACTPPSETFKAVSTGSFFACGINSDDLLRCWGVGYGGEQVSAVTDVPSGQFFDIASGRDYACAISVLGQLSCWGDQSRRVVREVPEGNFVDVSAGGVHACAVTAGDFRVICWGENDYGEAVAPSGFKTCPAGKFDFDTSHPDDIPQAVGLSIGTVSLLVVFTGIGCSLCGAGVMLYALKRRCGFDVA
eukprot:CAMPEP_0114547530 /NCGR_PEP_ID=MMETSP0114-20121206/4511_1 /TAXON_ID=31324 /ORGANISM="Goniomonas sp, Strain m" /LENGTH=357 /DNA_ID=CAMNT_0001732087 /DNA_START=54 /DNA_END=1123 /DNA_ORIENTATION=+